MFFSILVSFGLFQCHNRICVTYLELAEFRFNRHDHIYSAVSGDCCDIEFTIAQFLIVLYHYWLLRISVYREVFCLIVCILSSDNMSIRSGIRHIPDVNKSICCEQ